MLEATRTQMSDLVYRRARHCIGEDQRTLGAVEALKNKDYAIVGKFILHCGCVMLFYRFSSSQFDAPLH